MDMELALEEERRLSLHEAGEKFPMLVLPIDAALKLDRIKVHEDVRHELVEWKPGMDGTVFFSHTWLSYRHPDRDNVKWNLLLAILRRLVAGNLKVTPDWGAEMAWGAKSLQISAKALQKCKYIWMDYMCVPQADGGQQALAISSLAYYVTQSRFFVVLAGAWTHESGSVRDVRAWCGRGWCRVEHISNALSASAKTLTLAESATSISTHPPTGVMGRNWLTHPVGTGDFTVDADKEKLAPLIADLIDARRKAALKTVSRMRAGSIFRRGSSLEGQLLKAEQKASPLPKSKSSRARSEIVSRGLTWYRALTSCRRTLLQGLSEEGDSRPWEEEAASADELAKWMALMRFTSPTEEESSSGLSPLFFAVTANLVGIAKSLLQQGANVNVVLREGHVHLSESFVQGGTLLMKAAYTHDDGAMVKLLLDAGANTSNCATMGVHAGISCCMSGKAANLDAILAHSPHLATLPMATGVSPLGHAALFGQAALLRHVASAHPHMLEGALRGVHDQSGDTLCLLAVNKVGDLDTISALIELGVDINQPGQPGANKTHRTIERVAHLAARLVVPRGVLALFAYSVNCTPLHAAAYFGNLGALNLLLKHGANPTSDAHPFRMQPLHLAAMQGHEEAVSGLRAAGAPLGARDARGRTPAMCAARRGHKELAARLGQAAAGEVRL